RPRAAHGGRHPLGPPRARLVDGLHLRPARCRASHRWRGANMSVTHRPPPVPVAGWLSDEVSYRVLASLLLNPGSPEEVCQQIVELTEDVARVASCSVFLMDQTGEYLRLAATNNPRMIDHVGEVTHRVGEGLTGWVAKFRRTARVRDPRDPEERARLA